MLLVLSEEHKEHLNFLNKVDAAVVGEFGRIALEFIMRGTSPKVYEGAARKLSVPVEVVRHGVEGLMYLMTQSSKHMVPCPLSHITLAGSWFPLSHFPNRLISFQAFSLCCRTFL
uniref:COMM domain containing 2 n=1 Tax=Hippocampus comes TaxID=109280 RepID=A0A3Q3DUY0_HIPCM